MDNTISREVERVDAREKARGELPYLADYTFPDKLYGRVVRARVARGRILARNTPTLPEGYSCFDAEDIPRGGNNCVRMIQDDWPIFAEQEVRYYGEPLALLVGPDRGVLSTLVERFEEAVEYEVLEPVITIEDALAPGAAVVHDPGNVFADLQLTRGDPDAAFRSAARVIEEEYHTGYQEHVYIEPQALVGTVEAGRTTIYISTQCPFYVRKAVSHALGVSADEVAIVQTATGGGFGGKEHYPDVLACTVAIALTRVDAPIELILDRVEDLSYTSKRHASKTRYRVGIDSSNRITAIDVDLAIEGGAYESSSRVVLQRAMFSSNGVYEFPNIRVRGRAVATNNVPSDAFRGFGAPQALFAIELLMTKIARSLGVDELELKQNHMLRQGSPTMTNGSIHEVVKLPEMLDHVLKASDYHRKRALYDSAARGTHHAVESPSRADTLPPAGSSSPAATSRSSPRRGIAVSLFKHGSAFTGDGEAAIIKAKVRIRKRADNRPEILVSNVEIGQGVLTTFRKIVARVLEIPYTDVVYGNHNTAEVPDSGPTCASRSIAVVGYLLQEAAKKLKGRLQEPGEFEVEEVYRQPEHHRWDREKLQGDAYPAYSWGVNCVEVEVDMLTCEVRVTGIWTAFEVGRAIDEGIVRGQIVGGVIQGLGWAGLEKLENPQGRFLQHTMADYCIPTSMDSPPVDYVLFDNPYQYGPFGAKGAGEVVFDGIAPAFGAAIQQAIDREITRLPMTPEYLAELVHGTDSTIHAQRSANPVDAQPVAAAD